MQRQQKTEQSGYLYEGRVELKSSKGVPSIAGLETEGRNGAEDLMEQLLHRDNLNKAYLKVKQNRGKHGIDGMTIKEMLPYLKEHGDELRYEIREGRYKPKPVRRVEIPKPDGGVRLLGIPTVIDRMIQQAIVQVVEPLFEPKFSNHSYGFRPRRSAHQAIRQTKKHYAQGYTHVVDIDLEKYFDTVNHDLLMEMLREEIKDRRILALIRRYLKSGVMLNGIIKATEEGTPQGGNLSPLLSNIYLTRFDRELERRGHRFVRYADDSNIYVKSRRAAERVMESCRNYLEGVLKLKVNQRKSQVGSPMKLKFLGFSLCKIGKQVEIRIHEKSLERFKSKLRQKTKRNQGVDLEYILKDVQRYVTGWMNYYGIAKMNNQMKGINQWLRRRIRMYIWKQWKKVSSRFKNLKKLGISRGNAWEWANTRKGYWRISLSPVLTRSLTNDYLVKLGYLDIAKWYEVVHSNY